MKIIFIFLDGVGLGVDDPFINPFASAELPNLHKLLDGSRLLNSTVPFVGTKASLFALDASLGVPGLPQSATGQAVLLTGVNVPAQIGYHYGPKPDKVTASFLQDGGIFGSIVGDGKKAALLNAYPPGYFEGIDSGMRLLSAIPLAVIKAGLDLFTIDDLIAGRAVSADFTAQGWRERINMPDTPLLTHPESGRRIAEISKQYDFSFFEYWLTDYAGHGQNMDNAINLLNEFDVVLGALLESWSVDDLLLITSDHGNMEDLSTRRHTANPVPLLLIGSAEARSQFEGMQDLSGVAPAILRTLLGY
ncbi:MAG: peptidase [Chloroflexota bacterium]